MACLNLQLNNEQQQGGFLGPRISFSNDFGETAAANMKHSTTTYTEAPVSSDFEFSVPCFASNSADELFFRSSSKILPLKEKVVTLRDELLAAAANDDDDDGIFLPKSSGWWRFGRSQTQSQSQNHSVCLAAKKGDHKNHGGLETIDEANHYHRK
ncbi:uncharacterized protein LOC112507339 [Cynara cardunculus var. scolymus]|uniref:uncharacterized protein LOC112507339 n=1 Tax=Cynara cardunculus var. scolymus TaxID=59895 RepID=UPI000D630BB8|nr:uncharacterized protein LOC112507339 [Cynara cardunculus var. scolymus]